MTSSAEAMCSIGSIIVNLLSNAVDVKLIVAMIQGYLTLDGQLGGTISQPLKRIRDLHDAKL